MIDHQAGLLAVWACSPNAVFTAGFGGSFDLWNGNAWARPNWLGGVTVVDASASSRSDIWLSGTSATRGGAAVRFDGAATARFDPPETSGVRSVWAGGASLALAIADAKNGDRQLLQWNGTEFSPRQLPSGVTRPSAVAATSGTDVWLASDALRVDHWNGSSWSLAFAPSANAGEELSLVHALGPSAVVGAGTSVEVFDGGSWTQVPQAGIDAWASPAGDLCVLNRRGGLGGGSVTVECSDPVPGASGARIWGTSSTDLWLSARTEFDAPLLHLESGAWAPVDFGFSIPSVSGFLVVDDGSGKPLAVSAEGGAIYRRGP